MDIDGNGSRFGAIAIVGIVAAGDRCRYVDAPVIKKEVGLLERTPRLRLVDMRMVDLCCNLEFRARFFRPEKPRRPESTGRAAIGAQTTNPRADPQPRRGSLLQAAPLTLYAETRPARLGFAS